MKNTKTLQKQVEDLQKQIEETQAKRDEEREKLLKNREELDGLQKTFEISWRTKRLLPGTLEGEFYSEERDNRLYLPLIQAIEGDDELDIAGYIYRGDTPDEVLEFVEDNEREIIDQKAETIYYSEAIDYLKENDRTLTEALELAKNAGYDLDNLNSCILATLLKTENENYYWIFEDTMEKLREKAEEINKEREKQEEETGKTMAERIDERAKNRAKRHQENDRTPEELKRIEELQVEQREIDERRKNLYTELINLQEQLKKLENN